MFSFAAVDAGKGKTNASKAIPAGLPEDPQAEWKELLVRPVEGGWKTKIKRDRTLLKMDRVKAEGILTEIRKPINEGAENPEKITWTFAKFCEVVYLPVCHRKWKASTDMVEADRLEVDLVRPFGEKLMQDITRSELQALLDEKARSCGRSMIDHLRFRLRSVFALAMSEGVVDRNPACGTLYAAALPGRAQSGASDSGPGRDDDRSAGTPGKGDRAAWNLGRDASR